MSVTPLPGFQPIRFPQVSDAAPAAVQPGTPFASLMHTALQQMQTLETSASQSVSGLMSGSGTDIHTAMIATQKADLAFEMALSFRNKAVGAYQQLMNTQF